MGGPELKGALQEKVMREVVRFVTEGLPGAPGGSATSATFTLSLIHI